MKKNQTRRALLMSVLSLLLCCSMLIGTTFAWFTDSVTSASNIIKSGNLDVEMYWADGTKAVPTEKSGWTDASEGAIFNYNLWEPGYTQVRHIKIANEGTLALKYKVNIIPNGEVSKLADVIDVYYMDPAAQVADRAELTDANKLGTLTEVLAKLGETGNGELTAGASDTITIAFKMQETAGNEYMNLAIGTDFSIQLLATQLTYEKDSFGPDYDSLAHQSGFATGSAPAAGESKRYTIKDMGSGNVMATMDIHSDSVADADLPVEITIVPTEQDANVTVEADKQNAATFDVTVKNLKEDNQEPVSVNLYAGKNLANVQVYHKEVKIPNVNYDPATGFATFETTSFSPFTVVYDKPVAMIGDTAYGTIHAAFEAAEDGDVVVLRNGYNTTDAPLTESIVVKKNVTLNPNGMYLVSSAPATFVVEEGGKLTVTEGSFTIKNTASNGAAVLVDGGEFIMAGGSFDAHTAVRTAAGKSSTVTLAAGWSNRVTVGFDLKGDDVLNVTNGTLISSKQSVLATGATTVINMSGGTLSGKSAYTYNASVDCKGATTINMTGGKIESTNGESIAISVYNNSQVNVSGNAVVAGAFSALNSGGGMRPQGDNNVITISGDAKVSASGAGNSYGIGYAVYACSTNTDVTVSGNAQITGTSYGVYAGQSGSTITVADAVVIKATTGRYSGYGVGAEYITITGGTIEAKEYAVISDFAGSTVTIDNSVTRTPITLSGGIADVQISSTTNYTVAGDPVFDTVGTR